MTKWHLRMADKIHGFSLIELLIAMTIIVFVTYFTVTNYQIILSKLTARAIFNDLMYALQFARTESVVRHETIYLDKLNGSWSSGITVYTDDHVLHGFTVRKNTGNLYWRAFPKYHENLRFTPDGMLQSENGTFWFCAHGEVKPSWAIVMNKVGRARAGDTQNLSC